MDHLFQNHVECNICGGYETCFCLFENQEILLKNCVPLDLQNCIFCDQSLLPCELGNHLIICGERSEKKFKNFTYHNNVKYFFVDVHQPPK